MEPKLLLIVKPASGLNVWDLPRPQSQGALKRRAEPKGAQLYAYDIHTFEGVPYARLVPRDATRPEWVRVAEADHSVEYVDVIELTNQDSSASLADAIILLATAIRDLARAK
jgi:hypothetical protein